MKPSWAPALLRDLEDKKVKPLRDLSNGFMRIPKGTVMTAGYSTRWSGISLSSPKCKCCGVSAFISGVDINDLEPA